jgi:hypothetical protein
MRHALMMLLMATLVPIAGASAQGLPRLAPGQRVRVTAPEAGLKRQTGVLVALSPDTLTVTGLGSSVLVRDTAGAKIPLRMVSVLELSAGTRKHPVVGGVIGALAGGAAGVIGGLASGSDRGLACNFLFPCLSSGAKAAAMGLQWGFYGGILGALIGEFALGEHWEKVPLDLVRTAVRPLPGGRTGLGISLPL